MSLPKSPPKPPHVRKRPSTPTGPTTGGRLRSRGRKADKPAVPPQPLVATCAEKRTGREVPRCSFWDMRPADRTAVDSPLVFFQCRQAARIGFKVCGWHGAGFAVRERRGEREPRGQATLIDGSSSERAKRSMDEFLRHNLPLRERYLFHLNNPSLLDFRDTIALCRAVHEHFVQKANLDKTEMADGSDPPLLRAIAAAERLVNVVTRLAEFERRLGPVTHAEVERFLDAVSLTIAHYVPREQLAEASQYLTGLLIRDDRAPMGRGRLLESAPASGSAAPGDGVNGGGPPPSPDRPPG